MLLPFLRSTLRLLVCGFTVSACAALASSAVVVPLSERVAVGETFMGVRLLGNVRLPTEIDGQTIGGLSALAWSEDEQLLYALSDQSDLLHLNPVIHDGQLVDVNLVASYKLQDQAGNPLVETWDDSEGLALVNGANGIQGDGELLITFEIQIRIARFDNQGRFINAEPLPAALTNPNRFRTANKALEAITLIDGDILVAPEAPLQNDPQDLVTLFLSDGRSWIYPLSTAPGSSLVAMERWGEDNQVLFLERAFTGVTRPLIISLRQARLPQRPSGTLQVEDVAVFDSSKGWLLDNFEGLTHQRDGHFFMISDDNRHILQSTLLSFFTVTGGQNPTQP